MGQLSFLLSGISGLRQAWKFLNELDKRNVAKYSEQWWRELRKWVEIKIMRACMYEDTAISKLFKTDETLLHGALVFLKSDHLKAVEDAKGDDAKLNAAIKALDDKPTLYTRPTYPAH